MNSDVKPQFLFLIGLVTILHVGCAATRHQKIDVLLRQENWSEARMALEESILKNPMDGEAYLQLAGVYAELGKIPQMAATLSSAEGKSLIHPDDADFVREKYWIEYIERGNRFFAAGVYTEAARYFQHAVVIDSANVIGLERYAASLFMVKRFKEAGDLYRRVLAADPKNVTAISNLAEIYFLRKEFEPCIEMCDRVLAINEEDLQALMRRAYAQDAINNFTSAEEDYLLAVSLQPSADLLSDFGMLYLRHNKYKEAIARFEEALDLTGPDVQLFRQLAEASWCMRNYTAMVRWNEMIVQARPDDLAGWKNLAVAYEALGDKEQLAEARHFIDRISGTH